MITTSIIIPTYNRLERLKRVIEALENQDYDLMACVEVVIVSDGASDGTNEYLSTLQTPLTVRPVIQKNQGVAAARNNGVQQAQGDLIIFIDDDVIPAPQLVREHMRIHAEQGENVVVLGPMMTPDDYQMLPWVQWEQAMLYKQYDAIRSGRLVPTARQFFTGNTSLARYHLIETGGFDTRFRRAEDVELAYRLAERGIRFIFNPDAVGHHYAERSLSSWMAIPYTYGKCDVIFTLEKRQSWLLPTIWHEFHGRHLLTRVLTHVCLDRPLLSHVFLRLLKNAVTGFHALGWTGGTSWACSSIFNLRYYQGMADQLGGRSVFFAGVRMAETSDVQFPATETEG